MRGAQTRTIALYTTETMADWEYAYLTTQIMGAKQLKPGRFRLLLVDDRLEPVRTLGSLPLTPEADLDALDALANDGSLAALVVPGGDHYTAGYDRLIKTVGRLVDQEISVVAICGTTFLLARGGLPGERRHTSNAASYLGTNGYRGGAHCVETPVVTDRGATTTSGIHAVPFTAEVIQISGLVPGAMTDTWEQIFPSARGDNYMAPVEAVAA